MKTYKNSESSVAITMGREKQDNPSSLTIQSAIDDENHISCTIAAVNSSFSLETSLAVISPSLSESMSGVNNSHACLDSISPDEGIENSAKDIQNLEAMGGPSSERQNPPKKLLVDIALNEPSQRWLSPAFPKHSHPQNMEYSVERVFKDGSRRHRVI